MGRDITFGGSTRPGALPSRLCRAGSLSLIFLLPLANASPKGEVLFGLFNIAFYGKVNGELPLISEFSSGCRPGGCACDRQGRELLPLLVRPVDIREDERGELVDRSVIRRALPLREQADEDAVGAEQEEAP